LSRDLAIVDRYGIMALRNGQKWSEMGISVEYPLEVIEAVRKVNAIAMTGSRPPAIRPRLPAASASGNIVLRAEHASIGYPRHPLFSIQGLELRRGECAALIGPNGSGKTTFLKILLGQLQPLKGEVRLGAGLKIGYFAQAQDQLKGDHSVMDELIRHRNMLPGEARSYLAPYLFRGEDVFKPLSALSGGERARLALAILALEGNNFLLLDEPTNHLDIPAREALQEVLESFSGTILLVSHDRYLIDRLATQIWDLRDKKLNVFRGPYREFVLRGLALQSSTASTPVVAKQILLTRPMLKADGRETRRRIEALTMIEERIHQQESTIQRLSREMQKAGEAKSHEKVHQLSWKVAQAQNTLEDLLREWEKLAA
jgi:ATP-binding cassette subfamily F protein 3